MVEFAVNNPSPQKAICYELAGYVILSRPQ